MQIAPRKRHKKRLQPINREPEKSSRRSNGDRLLPKPNHCRKKARIELQPQCSLCVNHIREIKINVNIFAVLYFAPLNRKTVLNLTLLGAG